MYIGLLICNLLSVFSSLTFIYFWMGWVSVVDHSLQSMGSVVEAHGHGCWMAYVILVARPGIEPAHPVLEGRCLTTGPPGKSLLCKFHEDRDQICRVLHCIYHTKYNAWPIVGMFVEEMNELTSELNSTPRRVFSDFLLYSTLEYSFLNWKYLVKYIFIFDT